MDEMSGTPKSAFLTQIIVCAVVLIVILTGCTEDSGRPVLRIAEQHGLAYIPVALLRMPAGTAMRIGATGIASLQETTELRWERLNNATAIREAMVADRLDVGFMGIPPYIIGRHHGFQWSAFIGISRVPVGLVTVSPEVESFDDIIDRAQRGARPRIALPQPGSIQHILLAMMLENSGINSSLLDEGLVSMGHPDGMNALLAPRSDVVAHFTTPPYLFRELDHPEAALLVSGERAFGGPYTFIVGVAAPAVSDSPDTLALLEGALTDGTAIISDVQSELRHYDSVDSAVFDSLSSRSREVLEYLAGFYDTPILTLTGDIAAEGMVYETEIRGMSRFTRFMTEHGYLQ